MGRWVCFAFLTSIFHGRGSLRQEPDRKSTRLNSSHSQISYAVFCLKKKKKANHLRRRISGQASLLFCDQSVIHLRTRNNALTHFVADNMHTLRTYITAQVFTSLLAF